MKLLFSLISLVFLSFITVEAQKPIVSPTPPIVNEDDEFVCGLVSIEPVKIKLSVWVDKKGFLKNLTYKDFEVYDEKLFQPIDSFLFDEATNSIHNWIYSVFSSAG